MDRVGYRWVILAAGTFAQASFAAVSVGLAALGPALRTDYGLSLDETGVVLAAVGIGMLFTLLPWGLLADRIDERLVIVIGLTGAGAALVLAGQTSTYAGVVSVLIVAGALGASVNAASGRAVMAWFGPDEVGLALGIRQTAIPIGAAAAAASLPWLASEGGTELAFVVLGSSCVLGAAVAGLLMREAPRTIELGDVGRPLRERRLWLLGGGASLYLTAQIAATSFLVLFLHEHRGVSTQAAAGLLAAVNILGIAARIGAGRWSDAVRARVRPLRLIGLTLTAATVGVALLVDAPLGVLVPVLVVAGVLSMSWNGLAFAAAAEAAGAARTGAALGFQQTLLAVVGAAAPVAFAAVAAGSWRVAFALSAAGPLLGVAALGRVVEVSPRYARRRETSAIPPAAR